MLLVKDLQSTTIPNTLSELQQPHCVNEFHDSFDTSNQFRTFFTDIASGTSVDWAFNEFNIPLGYTFEFEGLGYGFVMPAQYILPNCYETRDALINMVAKARELGYMVVRT